MGLRGLVRLVSNEGQVWTSEDRLSLFDLFLQDDEAELRRPRSQAGAWEREICENGARDSLRYIKRYLGYFPFLNVSSPDPSHEYSHRLEI